MKKTHILPVRADNTICCGVYGIGLESRVGAVFTIFDFLTTEPSFNTWRIFRQAFFVQFNQSAETVT